jgi:hypothetical protein
MSIITSLSKNKIGKDMSLITSLSKNKIVKDMSYKRSNFLIYDIPHKFPNI